MVVGTLKYAMDGYMSIYLVLMFVPTGLVSAGFIVWGSCRQTGTAGTHLAKTVQGRSPMSALFANGRSIDRH